MSRLRAVGLVLALSFLGVSATHVSDARAQSKQDMEAARQAYAEGNTAFAEQRFAEAAILFQRGYDLSGKPRFLLNVAHAQRLAGDLRSALDTYEKFLQSDPRPEDRDLATQAVTEIQAELPPEPEPTPVVEAPPPEPEPVPVVQEVSAEDQSDGKPIYKRWYFWAGVGAVVVGAVVIGVVASGGGDPAPYRDVGTFGAAYLQ